MSGPGDAAPVAVPAARIGALARLLVWGATLALPPGTVRIRYQLEHQAELGALARSDQLPYAIGAVLSAWVLRCVVQEASTTDREERRQVMREWVESGTWVNADLRRRQGTDEVGFLKAGATFPRWLKVMWLPILLTVVGLPLVFVGPVPGLGALMVLGGGMASGGLALNAWLGK